MILGVIGLNHETANISQRERLATFDVIPVLKVWLAEDQGIEEATVLSTCNRYEIYFVAHKVLYHQAKNQILTILHEQLLSNEDTLLYHFDGINAVEHLYSVTCGLNSLIIGEDQILGQVKNCISEAQSEKISGKILNKLFREAISFAKSAKTEFKISENPLSLSYIAIKKAIESGYLKKDAIVTMVGLGKMGMLAIQYILEQPIQVVKIAVRSPEKLPQHILDHPKVRIASFEDRYQCIADSDVIISSTSAPHSVLRHENLQGYRENSLWIDLSMPRDIDTNIETNCSVQIWPIDYFKDISNANNKRRVELMELIKDMMAENIASYQRWLEAIEVDDLLKHWQLSIQNLVQEGLNIAENKRLISHPDQNEKWALVFESVLKKMIKPPLVNLKSIQDKAERDLYVKILKELYNYE